MPPRPAPAPPPHSRHRPAGPKPDRGARSRPRMSAQMTHHPGAMRRDPACPCRQYRARCHPNPQNRPRRRTKTRSSATRRIKIPAPPLATTHGLEPPSPPAKPGGRVAQPRHELQETQCQRDWAQHNVHRERAPLFGDMGSEIGKRKRHRQHEEPPRPKRHQQAEKRHNDKGQALGHGLSG